MATPSSLFTAAEIVAGAFDSAAVSAATSAAVSTVNAAAPDSTSISQARSQAVSAATNASTADSKALSVSITASSIDSKASSNSVNTSIADSKAVSVATATPIVTAVVYSTNISQADSKAVSAATALALFAGRQEVSLWDYGAVGNGTADDTTAINNWYAAIPDGWTGVIPLGQFRFTTTLSFNRNVNIKGYGPGSALVPDLNTGAVDGIVVNNHATNLMYRIALKDFAILSNKVNACRDTLVLNRVNLSEIDLHVKASSARYGTRLVGCLLSNIRICSSTNVTNATSGVSGGYPYPSGMPTSSVVRVQRDTVNAYSFNNNNLEVRIEGGNEGLYIEDQSSQGNNEITGVIEGVLGKGFYAKACIGLSVRNLHCEGNTSDFEMDTCQSCSIGGGSQFLHNSLSYVAAAGRITLTACTKVTLDSVYCDNLVVGSSCSEIQVTPAFRYGVGGQPTSIITDTGRILRGGSGQLSGTTASTATATPVTLFDLSTRGPGSYRVYAYLANTGTAYHAIGDYFYDGANASRITGTNGASMTTTLSGTNVQATQSSGSNQVISFIATFNPAV